METASPGSKQVTPSGSSKNSPSNKGESRQAEKKVDSSQAYEDGEKNTQKHGKRYVLI